MSAFDTHFVAGQGETSPSKVPRPIPTLAPLGIVQIACGENHSAALAISGRVYTWGRGKHGALGLGLCDNASWPQCVKALPARACQVSVTSSLKCLGTFQPCSTVKLLSVRGNTAINVEIVLPRPFLPSVMPS